MSYLYTILAYRKPQVPNSDLIRLKMSRSVSGWMGFGFVNHNWESRRSNTCQRPWFPEPDLIITLTSVLGPATPNCGGDAGCREFQVNQGGWVSSTRPAFIVLVEVEAYYHQSRVAHVLTCPRLRPQHWHMTCEPQEENGSSGTFLMPSAQNPP